MNTAGKFFSVLNLLLAVTFVVLTAPIAQHRQQMQKKVEAEIKKIADRERDIEKLDVDRLVLDEDIVRKQKETSFHITAGLNEQSGLQAKQARLTDAENDVASSIREWTAAVKEVQNDVEARMAEITDRARKVADEKKDKDVIKKEVTALQARFDRTKATFETTKKAIEKNYQRLVELVLPKGQAAQGNAAGRAARTAKNR